VFCICQILQMKWEYNGTVYQVYTNCKNAYEMGEKYCTACRMDLVHLQNVIRLIKMFLKWTYFKVDINKDKHLFDAISFRIFWDKEVFYDHCFPVLLLYTSRRGKKIRRYWEWMKHVNFWSPIRCNFIA